MFRDRAGAGPSPATSPLAAPPRLTPAQSRTLVELVRPVLKPDKPVPAPATEEEIARAAVRQPERGAPEPLGPLRQVRDRGHRNPRPTASPRQRGHPPRIGAPRRPRRPGKLTQGRGWIGCRAADRIVLPDAGAGAHPSDRASVDGVLIPRPLIGHVGREVSMSSGRGCLHREGGAPGRRRWQVVSDSSAVRSAVVRHGRPPSATSGVLLLAVRLALADGWTPEASGRRLSREVPNRILLRAARARAIRASATGEVSPAVRRVLDSLDRAVEGCPDASPMSRRGVTS